MTKEEFILRQFALHLSYLHDECDAADVQFNDKCRQAALDIATEDFNFIDRNYPDLFEHVQYNTQTLAGNPIEAPSCPPDTDDDYEAFKSSIEQILHEPLDFFQEKEERFALKDIATELAMMFDAIRLSKCQSIFLSPQGKMLAEGLIRTAALLYVHFFFDGDKTDRDAQLGCMEEYLKFISERICSIYNFIGKEEEDEHDFIERIEKQAHKLENIINVYEEYKQVKSYIRDVLNDIIIDCAIYFHRCPIPVDFRDYGHAVKCCLSKFSNK